MQLPAQKKKNESGRGLAVDEKANLPFPVHTQFNLCFVYSFFFVFISVQFSNTVC
jgi:hypothetical protein